MQNKERSSDGFEARDCNGVHMGQPTRLEECTGAGLVACTPVLLHADC